MNSVIAHGRIARLCDQDFAGWRLNIDAKSERQIVTQPDWPLYAAGFADLSGSLSDLPDEAADESLVELVRHGFGLFKMGIVTEEQVVAARNAVLRDVMQFGESIENTLHQVVENN